MFDFYSFLSAPGVKSALQSKFGESVQRTFGLLRGRMFHALIAMALPRLVPFLRNMRSAFEQGVVNYLIGDLKKITHALVKERVQPIASIPKTITAIAATHLSVVIKVEIPQIEFSKMTMVEFIALLQKSPVAVYRELVNLVHLHGVDFPFAPYLEILNTIGSYLDTRSEYFADARYSALCKDVDEEIKQGPRFTTSSVLIQDFLCLFPENSKGIGGYSDQIAQVDIPRNLMKAVVVRKEDQVILFNFSCSYDLDLMYFVNVRPVPVFVRGLGNNEGLNPPNYDFMDGSSRFRYAKHDDQHTFVMLIQESVEYLKSIDPKPSYLLEAMPPATYPMYAYVARLQRVKAKLHLEKEEGFKRAIELLLFYVFHEDEGGGFNFNPTFINQQTIILDKLSIANSIETAVGEGQGLKVAIAVCVKKVQERLNSRFAYPVQYKTSEVAAYLSKAEEWVFQVLNEERLFQESPAGKLEETSPEQQALNAEILRAAKRMQPVIAT